jgi:hypothetical protein
MALHSNRWMLDITGALSEVDYRQLVDLWLAIDTLDRETNEDDQFSWIGGKDGKYSAKDTYTMLCHGRVRSAIATPIWRSLAPLKCKNFSWLASRQKLWTSDRRARHGLQDHSEPCFTCLPEEDNVDDILAQCVFAREVWFGSLQQAGLQIAAPHPDSSFLSWWLETRDIVHHTSRQKFDTLMILTSWMLWKQRNARVFQNEREQCDAMQLIQHIKEELCLWELAHAGGSAPASRE